MKKIIIDQKSGSYSVRINNHIFDSLYQNINQITQGSRICFIVDQNVLKFHDKRIKRVFESVRAEYLIVIRQGETSKSYNTLQKVHKSMLENNFKKNTFIIAVGGGVTGDISALAASLYMRGIKIIHIPTTIIAMADSSIGGKTGINFKNVKNVIGSFYPPEMVIIDPTFLKTLPENVYNAGMGELIKYAFLSGSHMYDDMENKFNLLTNRDYPYLEEILYNCIKFKASVVQEDEKETGLRKILNFGHTFGHAFESASGFKLQHGMAVNGGIVASLFLSAGLGIIDETTLKKLLKLPLKLKLPEILKKLSTKTILYYMQQDKKNTTGDINLILLAAQGKILIDMKADKKEIVNAIKKLQKVV